MDGGPAPGLSEPTEAKLQGQVRSEAADLDQLPDEKQLVSILKRNLPAVKETVAVKDAPEWFQQMVQRIVRENVPSKYVQDKDWGKTDRRWDGLRVKRRGVLQWSTKRRWKEVNHGTWKRYEVTQIAPHENLRLRIENVSDAGDGKVQFDLRLVSQLHVFGRIAKWAKGVQVYNLSADADAEVRLLVHCEIGMKLDVRKFPPDVVVLPKVTAADLDVTEFKLQKVSKLKGPLVKQLSGSVHDVLMDKIEEKRSRLPEKINRQIVKNQDKMRLSLSDFAATKWEVFTGKAAAEPENGVKEELQPPRLAVTKTQPKPPTTENLPELNAPQEAIEASSDVIVAPTRVLLLDLMPPAQVEN